MGQLDEQRFAEVIRRCAKCGAAACELAAYLDRELPVMLGARNDDGRWAHDGEQFVDGVYRVRCLGCGDVPFASDACPRCHRAGGLADALETESRLAVPKRCPGCKGMELTLKGFAPATVKTGAAARPQPTPVALLGDAGFHVVHLMCDGCDWVALAEGCPLCGGAGPLRARPS